MYVIWKTICNYIVNTITFSFHLGDLPDKVSDSGNYLSFNISCESVLYLLLITCRPCFVVYCVVLLIDYIKMDKATVTLVLKTST